MPLLIHFISSTQTNNTTTKNVFLNPYVWFELCICKIKQCSCVSGSGLCGFEKCLQMNPCTSLPVASKSVCLIDRRHIPKIQTLRISVSFPFPFLTYCNYFFFFGKSVWNRCVNVCLPSQAFCFTPSRFHALVLQTLLLCNMVLVVQVSRCCAIPKF